MKCLSSRIMEGCKRKYPRLDRENPRDEEGPKKMLRSLSRRKLEERQTKGERGQQALQGAFFWASK